ARPPARGSVGRCCGPWGSFRRGPGRSLPGSSGRCSKRFDRGVGIGKRRTVSTDLPARPPAPPAHAVRAAWAVFAVFFVAGVGMTTWAARSPAVRDGLGFSEAEMGVLLLTGAIGSLVALPLSGMIASRIGAGRTCVSFAALA